MNENTRHRPWGDYALRIFCCALLFMSGYSLLLGSTFALRLRDDVPGGVASVASLVAVVLSVLPLLAGRRFLGVFLFSSFLLSGIGAYWWTLIPWDELVAERNFVTSEPPDFWRYLHVASPLVVAVLYVAASRASRLRAEYLRRGADAHEVSRASAASFLAGMGALVVTMTLAGVLWMLLASGFVLRPPSVLPRGLPMLLAAGAVVALVWALATGQLRKQPVARDVRRPSKDAAGRAGLARSLGRRSPF